MNLARKTLVSDAVPPAGLGRGGHYKGPEQRYDYTKAERAELDALCSAADPEDGIIGMGACMDAATRRPCQHSTECMRRALAHQPLTCHVRAAAIDEAAAAEKRKQDMLEQSARILSYMREAGEPVTLKDCACALGYGETPLLLRGAWNHLVHNAKIAIAGERYQRGYRHTHHVRTWVIAEGYDGR